MSDSYFHFTLGPVQAFVAQARRTRDFWAGSFILSWLSSVAMLAVKKQGGDIDFPLPDEAFMKALEKGGENGPRQGNVPNRFKARVKPDFKPEEITTAVQLAWIALAEHVWIKDLAEIANDKTRNIWDRQIASFWDMQWALVDDGNESDTLDRLKNWRTHMQPDEPGVKCMMMDGWQELSGALRPGQNMKDPAAPAGFWRDVRNSNATAIASDLRESEMLCAMAFVKRRFVRHFNDFRFTMPDGWSLKGWELPKGVPSLHYMAAAHWLELLIKQANEKREVRDALWAFHGDARKLTEEYGEWNSNIRCIRDAINSRAQHKWEALNGEVFFESMLENEKLWNPKEADAEGLSRKLRALQKKADLDPVTPFYAVLLMDGDELGIHMSDPDKQKTITGGLNDFTRGVADIVTRHSGFLIYAGGDDVLALLPLEDALFCACDLRRHYLECFAGSDVPTTLSGAVEYAHVKMPLGKVLADAHDLLDNIAKEKRGRDAIACRVWKPGGQALEWAMPWMCTLERLGAGEVMVIEQLAREFSEMSGEQERDISSKFFYRIRERFDLLNPPVDSATAVLDQETASDLLAMEYLNSGIVRDKGWDMNKAKKRIQPLLDQCRPVTREKDVPDCSNWDVSPRLEADGAMLVRFLATEGIWQ